MLTKINDVYAVVVEAGKIDLFGVHEKLPMLTLAECQAALTVLEHQGNIRRAESAHANPRGWFEYTAILKG